MLCRVGRLRLCDYMIMLNSTKIKKIKWEFFVERKYSPFSLSINSFLGNRNELKKVLDCNVKDAFLYYDSMCYVPENTTKIIADAQIKNVKNKDYGFLWNMATGCEVSGEQLLLFTKNKLKGERYFKNLNNAYYENAFCKD